MEARLLHPYHFFDRELEAYRRLDGNESYFPRLLSTVTITEEDEDALLPKHDAEGVKLYRRRFKQRTIDTEHLPLKALLLSKIAGIKAGPEWREPLKEHLKEAVEQLHAYGIVWGDVTWRNMILSEESGKDGKRLTLFDFSNAFFARPLEERGDVALPHFYCGDEKWEEFRGDEMETVERLIDSGKVTQRKAFTVRS